MNDEIQNGYSWIKVKQFKEENYPTLEEKYEALKIHHQKETEFLIRKVRIMDREVFETSCSNFVMSLFDVDKLCQRCKDSKTGKCSVITNVEEVTKRLKDDEEELVFNKNINDAINAVDALDSFYGLSAVRGTFYKEENQTIEKLKVYLRSIRNHNKIP